MYHGSKEELVEILEYVKDKVLVTGSYAEGRQTAKSDIDFYVKMKPEDEIDCEATFVEDTYAQEIIRWLDSKGIVWGSVFVDSMHTDDTLIPLEFSAYYKVDQENVFSIEIMGVQLMAAKSTYEK